MTVDEMIAALTAIRDTEENGGSIPLTAHSPGDPSVGIWEYNSEVKTIWADHDYDDETGERLPSAFAVIVLQD
jgi:hypothetical protein